jgi:hypothetical protein
MLMIREIWNQKLSYTIKNNREFSILFPELRDGRRSLHPFPFGKRLGDRWSLLFNSGRPFWIYLRITSISHPFLLHEFIFTSLIPSPSLSDRREKGVKHPFPFGKGLGVRWFLLMEDLAVSINDNPDLLKNPFKILFNLFILDMNDP